MDPVPVVAVTRITSKNVTQYEFDQFATTPAYAHMRSSNKPNIKRQSPGRPRRPGYQ